MENEKKDKHWYPPYRVFTCSCDDDKSFSYEELVAHAKEKHGTDIKGLKMNRELMVHVNRQPRHSSTYKWHAPGFTFLESIG